jgi:hypothetical protein
MDNPRKIKEAQAIAKSKNIAGTIEISKAKNKRFVIIRPDGKRINFGLFPFSGEGTFLDHGDEKIKKAWRARHSKILLKDGTPAYMSKDSPDYFAWRILWT